MLVGVFEGLERLIARLLAAGLNRRKPGPDASGFKLRSRRAIVYRQDLRQG